MRFAEKAICSLTVLCLLLGCFAPVPAFSASDAGKPAAQAEKAAPAETSAAPAVSGTAEAAAAQPPAASQPSAPAQPSSTEPRTPATDAPQAPPAAEPQTPPAEPGKASSDDESLWYNQKIPMKKEHQKLLWDYCRQRNLDYIEMLALIYLESNFDEKCSTKTCKGYFQISQGNCANLSKSLKTENKPLDGAININWGTAMYSWILADKRVKDLKGKEKRDAALSIYQRGTGGYDKYGLSKSYLKKYYKKWDIVRSWFEQAKQ